MEGAGRREVGGGTWRRKGRERELQSRCRINKQTKENVKRKELSMNEEHRTLRGVCMEHRRLDEVCFLGCVLDGGNI